MRHSREFGAEAKRLAGDRSLRELSRLTGISHTRISDIHYGLIPSYRLLVQYADGLELQDEDRESLFALAGYGNGSPAAEALPPDDHTALIARTVEETLKRLGAVTRNQETGEEAYWRLYGEAYKQLASEGIEMLTPSHGATPADWAALTPEEAASDIKSLVETSRRLGKRLRSDPS